MFFLLILFITLPCILEGLPPLAQKYNEFPEFDQENLNIYIQDLLQCLKTLKLFMPFGDQQAVINLAKENPIKPILAMLQCQPTCDTLTINHYNVLFQCLAQQRDNTKCCVRGMYRQIMRSTSQTKEEENYWLKQWIVPKGEFWKVPLGALDRDMALKNLFTIEKVNTAGMTINQLKEFKINKMREIGQEIQFKRIECLKLCNAEFPLNPWFYFPLIRSGVCERMYLPISSCLVPYGVLKGRAMQDEDFTGKEVP